LLERVDHVSAERIRVMKALELQGWKLQSSYANFIWLRTGDRTAEIFQNFESAGLSVRPFPGEGVRITIAEPDANDRVIQVLEQLI